MCGIIGYTGEGEALPVLVEGIRLLSYRGYDSAGVAVERDGALVVEKDKGRIEDLAPSWDRTRLAGRTGIGHTRWATHGRPSRVNAHPQSDAAGDVVVVHNGVLDNDIALREELAAAGVGFVSETDTEVFAHLFARTFRGDPVATARGVLARCHGRFALLFLHRRLPGTLVAVRRGSPLLVGLGRGECLVASDVRALAGRADRVLELEEDEIAVVTPAGATVHAADGRRVTRSPRFRRPPKSTPPTRMPSSTREISSIRTGSSARRASGTSKRCGSIPRTRRPGSFSATALRAWDTPKAPSWRTARRSRSTPIIARRKPISQSCSPLRAWPSRPPSARSRSRVRTTRGSTRRRCSSLRAPGS